MRWTWRWDTTMLAAWRNSHHSTFRTTSGSTHHTHRRTTLHLRSTSWSTHTNSGRHYSRTTSTRPHANWSANYRLLLRWLHRIRRGRLRGLHHTCWRWLSSRLLLRRWLRRKDRSHFTGCGLLLPLRSFFLLFHNFGCFL